MASPPAIRFIQSTTKSGLASVHLQCHVKPGANKQREGVLEISDVIALCVAAPAQDGEANKAVIKLISNVLKVPKSDVEVIRGSKSRLKTIAVTGIDPKGDETSCIARIKEQLEASDD